MSEALHLYALLAEPIGELPVGGFGEPLVEVEAGSIVAVAGAFDRLPATDEGSALAHARVVEDLARRADALLPGRFGERYDSREALADAVGSRAPALRAALDSVRRCAEIGLRAHFAADAGAAPPASGREYLLRRRDEALRLREIVESVHRPLAARARDVVADESLAPLRLRASYLVSRDAAGSFLEEARSLASGSSGAEVVVFGPWAPYSFGCEAVR